MSEGLQPLNAPRVVAKASSSQLFTFALRVLVAVLLGVTMALIGQTIIGYGGLSYIFVSSVVGLLFMSISRKWGWIFTLFFAVFCWLAGLLLRMYALAAPGQ